MPHGPASPRTAPPEQVDLWHVVWRHRIRRRLSTPTFTRAGMTDRPPGRTWRRRPGATGPASSVTGWTRWSAEARERGNELRRVDRAPAAGQVVAGPRVEAGDSAERVVAGGDVHDPRAVAAVCATWAAPSNSIQARASAALMVRRARRPWPVLTADTAGTAAQGSFFSCRHSVGVLHLTVIT